MPTDDPRAPTLPPGTRTVLLFGGTFDPPHRAHIEIPAAVRRAVDDAGDGPATVVYIPAARSPFKATGPTASGPHRVRMLEAALADAALAESTLIWTEELDRAERAPDTPSYTIDTVRAARNTFPEPVRLRLLIGADQAVGFHRWREPRALIAAADPLVMLRPDGVPGSAPDARAQAREDLLRAIRDTGAWSDEEARAWEGRIVAVPQIAVSATEIRAALAANPASPETEAALRAALSPGVLGYIRRHGLYAAGPQSHP